VKAKDPSEAASSTRNAREQIGLWVKEICDNHARKLADQLSAESTATGQKLLDINTRLVAFQQASGFKDEANPSTSLVARVAEMDSAIKSTRAKIEGCDLQISLLRKEVSKFSPALVAARDALANALVHYTEESAKVRELRATVIALEKQATDGTSGALEAAAWTSPLATSLVAHITELKTQQVALVRELEQSTVEQNSAQKALQSWPENRSRFVQLKAEADAMESRYQILAENEKQSHESSNTAERFFSVTLPSLGHSTRWQRAARGGRIGAIAGMGGFFAALVVAMSVRKQSVRLRSKAALSQVSGLPVLASMPNLAQLTEADQQHWAFQTFTMLRGTLRATPAEGLVCGLTSSTKGEGRSSCIRLLANAAARQGFKVMVIDASVPDREIQIVTTNWGLPPANPEASPGADAASEPNALAVRREVGAPLDTWVWHFDHRKAWKEVSKQWCSHPDLVVLIELPPASEPQSLLLAEQLPNVLWISGNNLASFSNTWSQLKMLRSVNTRLAGAIFNNGPKRKKTKHFPRLATLWLALGFLGSFHLSAAPADRAPLPPAVTILNTNQTLSISPVQLAPWQQHFTLGSGDVLDISLQDQPDTSRGGLIIGPDGRINYLEAHDVMVTGLSVDELRGKLEQILAKFHRAPRVIVNPTAYNSKKYFILGNVNQKGVFSLGQPVSIIEAIAKARGFISGTHNGATLVQADLGRSFLVRKSDDGSFGYLAIDFEGLFLRGDLAQNIALQPDDYLFFPPPGLQELYILGDVRAPGIVPYNPTLTALGAITARGGFTDQAWKTRVLVVRGSLNNPKTFIVNISDVLAAKGPDFQLQSRDIIYIHRKPWAKAEELVESAVTSFARAFVIGVVGQNVPAIITEPWIK
jgi:protein involved in polysaccharide export with SLBB domain